MMALDSVNVIAYYFLASCKISVLFRSWLCTELGVFLMNLVLISVPNVLRENAHICNKTLFVKH